MEIALFRIFAFDIEDDKEVKNLTVNKDIPADEQDKNIYCALCSNIITTVNDRTNIDGKHEHIFSNPHGYVYQIGCFKRAKGCYKIGTPTNQFTWFPGYSWCYAACKNCNIHMGWYYTIDGGSGFWGLIMDRLTQKKD